MAGDEGEASARYWASWSELGFNIIGGLGNTPLATMPLREVPAATNKALQKAFQGFRAKFGTVPQFSDDAFNMTVDSGGDATSINIYFRGGADKSGYIQITPTRSSRDLYIDIIKVETQKTGLGQELMRRAIQQAESLGGKVKTLSGNLRKDNLAIFLKDGLEATPAFKFRTRFGFTKIIVSPTKDNGYNLIMGR